MLGWLKTLRPRWLYMECIPGSRVYKRRGLVDEKSNPEGFARLMMAKGNLRVLVSGRDKGPIYEPGEKAEKALVIKV